MDEIQLSGKNQDFQCLTPKIKKIHEGQHTVAGILSELYTISPFLRDFCTSWMWFLMSFTVGKKDRLCLSGTSSGVNNSLSTYFLSYVKGHLLPYLNIFHYFLLLRDPATFSLPVLQWQDKSKLADLLRQFFVHWLQNLEFKTPIYSSNFKEYSSSYRRLSTMIWEDIKSWEKQTYDIWELDLEMHQHCSLAANQINQTQK